MIPRLECKNCGTKEFKAKALEIKLFNSPYPLTVNRIECIKCGEVAAVIHE